MATIRSGSPARILILLPVLALIFGVIEYGPARSPDPGSLLMTLHTLLSLGLVFVWFLMDARRRAYRPSWFLRGAMIAVTVVALPYYLIRSRGRDGAPKTLALGLLLFAGTMMAYHLGSILA